ncbi:MAG TPA: aldo/keto reductase [Longimicrobiales bacterium]|nr:aldo/keto reductase [Longimicrobiales bacterium]
MRLGAAAAGALAFGRRPLVALDRPDAVTLCGSSSSPQELLHRAVPSTGERLPAVGLGTYGSFSDAARRVDEHRRLRRVLRDFTGAGGRVIDAAPPYHAAEDLLGDLAQELGVGDDVFWAANVSIRASGGRDAGERQVVETFENLGPPDLYQVHDLLRWQFQLPLLRDLKAEGRIRYVGVTVDRPDLHDELEPVLRAEALDFVQLDYSAANRHAEERLIPLARDRGVAVLVNGPFDRGRLFRRAGAHPFPVWAREFGADTWAQLFLKWVLAEEAVTAVLPGTADPEHVRENVAAGLGRLPDPEERTRITRLVEGLPGG